MSASEMERLRPPWIVFNRGDGMCDVLPAMRPGEVVENIPPALARELVMFGNSVGGIDARLHAIEKAINCVRAALSGSSAPQATAAPEELLKALLAARHECGLINKPPIERLATLRQMLDYAISGEKPNPPCL